MRRSLLFLLIPLLFPLGATAAGVPLRSALSPTTEEVFSQFRDRVVQVRVLEAASGAKASIGSGFFVSAGGLLLTNYHVVSDFVQHPDRYRVDIVRPDKSTATFTLITFDVVNDLALGTVSVSSAPFFSLVDRLPPQGARLYSLGNPLDLGATIVEGTFNGFIEKSFYDKLHFTGALNPGMSGGPAILSDGRVVGVNVATAGDEVGFLVPAAKGRELMARAAAWGRAPEKDFMLLLRDQLVANQDRYVARLTSAPFAALSLEEYEFPGQISPAFKCWADQPAAERLPYSFVATQCSTEEELFVGRDQQTGTVYFRHSLLMNRRLNSLQFAALVEKSFSRAEVPDVEEEDAGNFACRTDFLEDGGAVWKTAVCLRAYKRLPGLYDLSFSAASLPRGGRAAVTQLSLAGVTVEKADVFLKRTLEAMRCKTPGS